MFAQPRSEDNGLRKPAVVGVRHLDEKTTRTYAAPRTAREVRGTREISGPLPPTDRDRHDWLMPLDLT